MTRSIFWSGLLLGVALLSACGGGGGDADTGLVPASSIEMPSEQAATFPAPSEEEELFSKEVLLAEDMVVEEPRMVALAAPTSVPPAMGAYITTIYVAPHGNDAWSGSTSSANAAQTDGPVRSITVAQSIARGQLSRMNIGGAPRAPIQVLIAPGEYALAAPLAFGLVDSGTADAPVTYAAVIPGTVTISGGRRLVQTGLGTASSPATFANAADAASGFQGGGQLYVNGARATLARQPNSGSYWFINKAVPVAGEDAASAGSQAFTVEPAVSSWLGSLDAAHRSRAIVNVMHSWTASHHRLANLAVPAETVSVTPKSSWPFLRFGGSQRFYVENVPSALDAAGEFLWDANGVRYMPKAGETGAALQATMPVLERLVTIGGSMAQGRWAEHIRFSGLTFAHTRALVKDEGMNDSQAGVYISAAIELDSARNISFDKVTVKHTGGYAIWMRRAVSESSITDSVLTDLGAGGIKVGGPNQVLADPLHTGKIAITGNAISHTGKIFPGAVGILIAQSFDNVVANNAVFDTTYTGISVGWTWGYGATTSGRNAILDNLLFNIGSGQLSDMAAIYSLGNSPGTLVSGNVIRQVRGYPGYGPGAWGLFSDEGTSGILYRDNIVVGTDSGGYHLNYGRGNMVVGNLLAKGDKAEVQVSASDPAQTRLVVQDNLLMPSVTEPFYRFAQAPDALFSGNRVSHSEADGAVNVSKCGSGCVASTATLIEASSPRGISVAGDSAFAEKVAALVAKVGPSSVPVQGTVAVDVKPVAPVAPVLRYEFLTDAAALGTQPVGLQYSPKGDLSAAAITAQAGAPGGRCLMLNEDPSRRFAYDPYVVALLKHEQGSTEAQFSIRIDADTNFVHEWRDSNSPYRVGPSITITRSGIWVAGKVVAPIVVGEWTTIKISVGLGGTSSTWKMEVQGDGGRVTTVPGIPLGSADWKILNWMGFVSYAKVTSSACLANIRVATTTPL